MNFASPKLLWLLPAVLPLLVLFFVFSWRKKQKLMRSFIQSRLLESLTAGFSPTRQKQKFALITTAVVLLFIALARPQFGFGWEEAKQAGIDMVIAIDTSRSMLAEDVSPNRMARAKMAVLDLLRYAKSDRLALVAFAGTAFLQCPLTLDETAFQQSLETLNVGVIPAGGSDISEAIEISLTAFEKGNDNHKVLILFTDGEDHDKEADEAVEKAVKAGLKIFTVGVGTAEGELIRVTDQSGAQTFLKDEAGNVVKSRLNETLLQHIATMGNGFYLPLKGAQPMEVLYNRGLATMPRGEASAKVVRVYKERYHWPLGLAILLLALESLWPETRRQPKLALILLFLFPLGAFGSPGTAYKKYQAGNYAESLAEYERLARERTNDFRLQFNAGAAAYQSENFKKALGYFNQATLSPDLRLQQQGYYNSGNTYFQLGTEETDIAAKKKSWQQAITNYSHSLKLNPKDQDAANNLQFVQQQLQMLEQQQKEQQQQQDQQNQNQKNEDKKEDQQQQNKNDQKNQQDQQQKDQQQQNQSDKQDQQKQQEQQKSQDQKQQEQGSDQAQSKPQSQGDKEQQQAQGGDQKKPGEQEAEEAAAVALGKMTQEQAFRVLEAQRQDERTLIFQPPQKQDNKPRSLKDW